MATTPDAVRYSTGAQNIGDAKNFKWEYPVPVNRFWDDLDWKVGRNFLSVFRSDERATLPIDPNSTASVDQKLQLLLKLLRDKLDREDAASSPSTYYDTHHDDWMALWSGIMCMQTFLKDPEEEQTIRVLIERRKDKSNLAQVHGLCAVLLQKGKYAEVEAIEPEVRDWLDGKLGRHSPQAISARHMIAQAVWLQSPHRRDEAMRLFSEIDEDVKGMSGPEFEVYQGEYTDIIEKSKQDLKRKAAKDVGLD